MVPAVNKRLSGQHVSLEETALRRAEASPSAVLVHKNLRDRGKLGLQAAPELSTGAGSENTPGSYTVPGHGSSTPGRPNAIHRLADDTSLDEEAMREWIREKAAQDTAGRRPGKLKDPNLPVSSPSESLKENQLLDQLLLLYNQGKTSEWLRGFKALLEKLDSIDKNGSEVSTQKTRFKGLQSHPVFIMLYKEFNKALNRNNGQISTLHSVSRQPNQKWYPGHPERRLVGMSSERGRVIDEGIPVSPVQSVMNTSSAAGSRINAQTSEQVVAIEVEMPNLRTKVEVNLEELFQNEANHMVQEMSESNSSKPKRNLGLYRPTERGSFLGKRLGNSQLAYVAI